MNYIRHLNTFFSLIKTDSRLTSSHISLYIALFHYWNFNRFNNPFSIYRENIMQLSKIGSKNTYHKCIKELHNAKYIYYHPAPSKFQVVRISVIRLDSEPEQKNPYKQLDLFGTENDTDNVPKLGHTSTDFDTDTVSKMGHLNKLNINKQNVLHPPTNNFLKNDSEEKNKPASPHVSKMGHYSRRHPKPSINEVQEFFKENNYPVEEAQKFYHYNQGKSWMLTDKIPITDWKAIAKKWMLNLSKEVVAKSDHLTDFKFLFNSFLEGKDIFKYITAEHFDQLKLQLTNDIFQKAWKARINQVSGTNQHSMDELWQAYLTYDPENELVKKDKPHFIALAKRIAVMNHFHKLKNESK